MKEVQLIRKSELSEGGCNACIKACCQQSDNL